jgi:hypothetical protein
MADMFDMHEEELGGVLQSSSRHLGELQQLTGVAFLGKQRELTSELGSAKGTLQQMKLAIRSVGTAQRGSMEQRMKMKETDLNDQKAQFDRICSQYERSSLLGVQRGGGSELMPGMQQRMTLAESTRNLERGNDMLAQGLRSLDETETGASATLEELNTQRETLLSSQKKARSITSLSGQARKLIFDMSLHGIIMKLVFGGICLLFVAVVLGIGGVVIYSIVKDKVPAPTPAPSPTPAPTLFR